tara:strand:+ start:845 stop:1417 length:573 start_codon:yes stop_codon:yes gene_type:complete
LLNLNKTIQQSVLLKNKILYLEPEIKKSINLIYKSLKKGGKIFLCGNGGSAADAQHLAAEFTVRLRPNVNRKALPAIALSNDISTLTACGNDYSFEKVFTRNLEALYKKNDILIVITTSGDSKNILNILKYCKKNNIKSIGLLGNKGGKAKKYCSINIIVPSTVTARIQETHIFLGHFIFESVERLIFRK